MGTFEDIFEPSLGMAYVVLAAICISIWLSGDLLHGGQLAILSLCFIAAMQVGNEIKAKLKEKK